MPDAFKLARILLKLNLKEVLKEKVAEYTDRSKAISKINDPTEKEKQTNEMGVDIIFDIMEHGEKAEDAFYDFLSGPFEMTKEEVLEISLVDIVPKFKEMAGQNNLENFFKSVLH